eukprot:m.247480 g.247480  ORF g.247480 m.247480 type:complete len:127 (+) comp79736_c0_seq1:69-449(+)
MTQSSHKPQYAFVRCCVRSKSEHNGGVIVEMVSNHKGDFINSSWTSALTFIHVQIWLPITLPMSLAILIKPLIYFFLLFSSRLSISDEKIIIIINGNSSFQTQLHCSCSCVAASASRGHPARVYFS